ncbi:MAG TPA: hypothetical protein VGM80_10670 [Gaiellaceae bacterium]
MKKFALVVVALLLGCAAAASAAVPQRSVSVLTSSTKPGAKPVALMLSLTYEMQCGNPGRTPLTLTLPSQMTAPAKLSRSEVLLNGKPAKSAVIHGSKVTITIEQPQFLTCDVIGMGTLKVVILKKAGLGNPKKPGIYGFPIEIGPIKGTPMLRIA